MMRAVKAENAPSVLDSARATLAQTPQYKSGTQWDIVYVVDGGGAPVACALSEDGCWLTVQLDAGEESAREIDPRGPLFAYRDMFVELQYGASVTIPNEAYHADIWRIAAACNFNAIGLADGFRAYQAYCKANHITQTALKYHGYEGPDIMAIA